MRYRYLLIVFLILILLILLKKIYSPKVKNNKPVPNFIYYSNFYLNCSGRIYFVKKNGKIDSTYLIFFKYKNNKLLYNISYYGIFINKSKKTMIPKIILSSLISIIEHYKSLNYTMYGSNPYSIRIKYYKNKNLFKSVFYIFYLYYPNKTKYLIDNYQINNNSYIFLTISQYRIRYMEVFLNFKNNDSMFYIISKCYIDYPFLGERL